MLRNESQASDQLGNAQRASGWGTSSGYAGAARENLRYGQGAEQAALGQGLTSGLAGLALADQQSANDRDSALYQAELDDTRNNIAAGNFNPGDYSGLGGGGPAADVAPKPKTPSAPKRTAAPAPATRARLLRQVVQRRAMPARKGR